MFHRTTAQCRTHCKALGVIKPRSRVNVETVKKKKREGEREEG